MHLVKSGAAAPPWIRHW